MSCRKHKLRFFGAEIEWEATLIYSMNFRQKSMFTFVTQIFIYPDWTLGSSRSCPNHTNIVLWVWCCINIGRNIDILGPIYALNLNSLIEIPHLNLILSWITTSKYPTILKIKGLPWNIGSVTTSNNFALP